MEKNVRAVSLIIQLKELYVVLSFTTPPDNTAVEPTHTSLKLKSAVTDTGTFKVCWCFGAWCFFFFVVYVYLTRKIWNVAMSGMLMRF